jgi:sodium pump decarboxylase gamma subunit
MKHIFKKVSTVCTAMFCAATITFAGAGLVWASEDDSFQEAIIATAESLTDTIIPLTDEEIEQYANSGNDFTMQAMDAWTEVKEELGAQAEDEEQTEVSYANGEYTVTVSVPFESYDAEFVYVFDENDNGIPSSIAIDVIYPMSVTLKRAAMNTVMGIGTVFVMLVFLSFVISLFKYIPNGEKKKKEAAAQTPAPAPVAAAPVEEEELADDTELVAVIAAAIAASEGTTPDGFVVRSIRKVNRKKR